jgi:hypothetical protein
VRPISMATVIVRLKSRFGRTRLSISLRQVERAELGNSGKWIIGSA